MTSGQCFVKLLGQCYMGDGRLSAPGKDRLAERVEDALVKGNCRRAMGLLSRRSLLNPDSPEGIRVAHELHPGPIEGYEAPVLQPTENMDLPARITEEEVVRAVKSMGLSKSPGPSGLGPAHWRVLIQAQGVPEALAQAFNEILGAAQRRGYRALYEFRLVLIPKDETGSRYRPIAISETIMMALHKIVLSRLRTQILALLETEQIALHRMHMGGVRMAYTEMQADGTHAVSLGITNAFNSIPREEILRGLDQASVPLILRNHIEAFLQLRHAAHLDSVPCGVPQGDPLSMLLYCVGQNLFIKELKERYPRLIAYADDILIFHSDNSDATGIVTEATTLAKRYGLTVNTGKCQSTQRGQEVSFLGARSRRRGSP
ncbi:Reverse transcriptase/endonuclease, putative [Giardia lamblia P15]|uniref:Reverse transcriptase/endonuclease, putative n=1 Tax=Giardia intestinalis (strain P15) TaxID=658858 RepID=E1EWN3_GIAIA|nr:Reverse transcriptase/endonuclease, putative [Giardia lamblia P15]